jgi:hypothetical protein
MSETSDLFVCSSKNWLLAGCYGVVVGDGVAAGAGVTFQICIRTFQASPSRRSCESGVFWLLGFFSRIVSRINEGNIKRPSEAKLDDRLLVGCPDMMSVIWRIRQK